MMEGTLMAKGFVGGSSTLYGLVVEVGPRWLVVEADRAGGQLHVMCDSDLAEALQARLGLMVGLDGEATWTLPEFTLVGFTATADIGYRPEEMPITEAFAELARCGPFLWDEIGVDAFMKMVRGD